MTHHCCHQQVVHIPFVKKAMGLVSWMLPGVILLLMPKCPACLAAYVALVTGLSLTASVAGYLQTGLIVLCSVALGVLSMRFVMKWWRAVG